MDTDSGIDGRLILLSLPDQYAYLYILVKLHLYLLQHIGIIPQLQRIDRDYVNLQGNISVLSPYLNRSA